MRILAAHLEFDVRYDTFDRDLQDEGTKVLNGHWDKTTGNWVLTPIARSGATLIMPNYLNPQHYIRFQDRLGNITRVTLNGFGQPAGIALGTGTHTTPPGSIHVEKYDGANLFLLGIPVSLE